MYQPKTLILKDWLSYEGEHRFDFINGKPILLQGQNEFDEGVESNGSGKSSLNDAIYYSNIGTSYRGVRDIKLINRGSESSELTFIYLNLNDNSTLTINRHLFKKGSAKLNISDTSDPNLSFSSINEGNQLILKKLGVTLEDFQNFFIVNKDKYISFFESSEAKKTNLIGRFSNANSVNGVFDTITKEIKEYEEKLKPLLEDKIAKESALNVYKTELENLGDSVDVSDFEAQIKGCKETIEENDDTIVTLTKEVVLINKDLEILEQNKKDKQAEIDKISIDDKESEIKKIEAKNDALNKEIESLEEDLKAVENDKEQNETLKSNLEKIIEHSAICPNCNHEFTLEKDSEITIEEAKENVVLVEVLLEELDKSINDIGDNLLGKEKLKKSNRQSIINIETEINNLKRKKRTLNTELEGIEKDISTKTISKDNKEKQIKSYVENNKFTEERIEKTQKEMELYKENYTKDRRNELQLSIDTVEVLLSEITESIDNLNEELKKRKYWELMFKKFKTTLSNKSLHLIQGYTNMYLKNMKTNLQIRIEGYKQLADGSIKENITPLVYRNGILEGEFREFSGGEKGRLEFAVLLALQQLINMSTDNKGIDLLIADEVFESIDGVGISNMLDSAENINKTVMITTHVNVKRDHGVVLVKKTKNGSEIEVK